MNIGALLFGWLPVMLGVGSLAGSTLISWKTRSVTHCCLSVIVFACIFWSSLTLYRIFGLNEQHLMTLVIFGKERLNWLPHLIILAAFSIFAAQGFYVLGRETKAA